MSCYTSKFRFDRKAKAQEALLVIEDKFWISPQKGKGQRSSVDKEKPFIANLDKIC